MYTSRSALTLLLTGLAAAVVTPQDQQLAMVTVDVLSGGTPVRSSTVNVVLGEPYRGAELQAVSSLYLVGATFNVEGDAITCTPSRGLPFNSTAPSYLSTNTVVVDSVTSLQSATVWKSIEHEVLNQGRVEDARDELLRDYDRGDVGDSDVISGTRYIVAELLIDLRQPHASYGTKKKGVDIMCKVLVCMIRCTSPVGRVLWENEAKRLATGNDGEWLEKFRFLVNMTGKHCCGMILAAKLKNLDRLANDVETDEGEDEDDDVESYDDEE
ncbi:hypothetical protein F4778DRAFT_802142 [Xylariomycetidae sp. FL2044]|nr:hypothetical protein F4778DRAFT_802142 [Xylariomycetidae sp. FL2044]